MTNLAIRGLAGSPSQMIMNGLFHDPEQTITNPNPSQYSIRDTVSNSILSEYQIIGKITNQISSQYTIVDRVEKTVLSRYEINDKITKQVTSVYSIKEIVTNVIPSQYAINDKIEKSFSSQYIIKIRISKSIPSVYKIEGKIANQITSLYTIVVVVKNQITSTYEIERSVTNQITSLYTVTGAVKNQITSTYEIERGITNRITSLYTITGVAKKQATSTYRIINTISNQATSTYEIQKTISNSIPSQYTIEQKVANDVTSTYAIENHIAKQTGSIYSIAGKVTNTVSSEYEIKKTALNQIPSQYKIIQRVVKRYPSSYYKIEGRTRASISSQYVIVGKTTNTISSVYTIKKTISSQITSEYEIRKNITNHTGSTYKISGRVTRQVTSGYDIENISSNSVSSRYEIRKKITNTVYSQYEIDQKITKTIPSEYQIIQRVKNTYASSYYKIEGRTRTSAYSSYSIIQRVVNSQSSVYQIKSNAVKSAISTYEITGRIIKSIPSQYEIKLRVQHVITSHYTIKQLAEKTISSEYQILELEISQIESKYSIRNKTGNFIFSQYEIRLKIQHVITSYYNIKQLAEKTISSVYQILKSKANQMESKYSIRNKITNSVLSQYEIEAKVSKSFSSVYFVREIVRNTDNEGLVNVVYDTAAPVSVSSLDGAPSGFYLDKPGINLFVVGEGTNTVYQFVLDISGKTSTMRYISKSFDVGNQENIPTTIYLNDDLSKMWILGASGKIHQYTLSTPGDITTATYDNKLFSVRGQELDPRGMSFNDDFTKMWVVGHQNDEVNQYSLSTSEDVSTITYDNKSFSVRSQELAPSGMYVNPKRKVMYIIGTHTDTIYKYKMSDPDDISTAVYTGVSLDVSAHEMSPSAIRFSDDLSDLYVLGFVNKQIHQFHNPRLGLSKYSITSEVRNSHVSTYEIKGFVSKTFSSQYEIKIPVSITLDSAYDIRKIVRNTDNEGLADAVYDTAAPVSVSSLDGAPSGFYLDKPGINLFIVGESTNTVYQFVLDVSGKTSTMRYVSKSFYVGNQETITTAVYLNDNLSKMWILGAISDKIHQYVLDTPGDISTARYDNKSFSIKSQEPDPRGLSFNDDFTKMWVVGHQNDKIHQYSLSIAEDIISASYDNKSFYVGNEEETPSGLYVNARRKSFFVIGTHTDTVYKYEMPDPNDISTAVYTGVSLDVSAHEASPSAIRFSDDLSNLYVLGFINDQIHQYHNPRLGLSKYSITSEVRNSHVSTYEIKGFVSKTFSSQYEIKIPVSITLDSAYDIREIVRNTDNEGLADAVYDTAAPVSVSSLDGAPSGFYLDKPGINLFIVGEGTNTVYQFVLDVSGKTSTMRYIGKSFYVGNQEIITTAVYLNDDLSKMWILGAISDKIHQYTLSTPGDLSTATYDNKSFNVRSQEHDSRGLSFNDNFTKMYVVGHQNDKIHQYSLSTPEDVSTASYDNKSFYVGNQEGTPSGMYVNPKRKAFFVVGTHTDTVYKYEMPDANDISTARYTGVSLDVSAYEMSPSAIRLSDDLSNLYIMGFVNKQIHQYHNPRLGLSKYGIITTVTNAVDCTYTIEGKSVKIIPSQYQIEQRITKATASGYSILKTVGTKSFASGYLIRVIVSDGVLSHYTIIERVADGSLSQYSIISRVTHDVTSLYSIRSIIANIMLSQYIIRVLLVNFTLLQYAIRIIIANIILSQYDLNILIRRHSSQDDIPFATDKKISVVGLFDDKNDTAFITNKKSGFAITATNNKKNRGNFTINTRSRL